MGIGVVLPKAGQRAGLVLVQRKVTRASGKVHLGHYWVRPEEVRPDDKRIDDPGYIKRLDEKAERARQILRSRWRERKKLEGKAVPPEQPPPKPVGPTPFKNPAPEPKPPTLTPEEQRIEDMLEQSPQVQLRRSWIAESEEKIRQIKANYPTGFYPRGHPVAAGTTRGEIIGWEERIKSSEQYIADLKSTGRSLLRATAIEKVRLTLPMPEQIGRRFSERFSEGGAAATLENAKHSVGTDLALVYEGTTMYGGTLAPGTPAYKSALEGALANGMRAMTPILAGISEKVNDAVSMERVFATFEHEQPARQGASLRHFKATDHVSDNPDAVASCERFTGTVKLNYEQAELLLQAVVNGEASSSKHVGAIENLTHELMHGASHSDYDYESYKRARTPHRAMEEATTEILGQHYYPQVARELGIAVKEPPRGIFEAAVANGLPYPVRAVAYFNFVDRFGQMASFVDGHLDKQEVTRFKGLQTMLEIEEHHRLVNATAVRYASAVKPMRGSMRYRYMADRYLERSGVPRHTKAFNDARNAVAEPRVVTVAMRKPPAKSSGRILGTDKTAVPELVRLLHDEAKVI